MHYASLIDTVQFFSLFLGAKLTPTEKQDLLPSRALAS
jgi:hypothetical protein